MRVMATPRSIRFSEEVDTVEIPEEEERERVDGGVGRGGRGSGRVEGLRLKGGGEGRPGVWVDRRFWRWPNMILPQISSSLGATFFSGTVLWKL